MHVASSGRAIAVSNVHAVHVLCMYNSNNNNSSFMSMQCMAAQSHELFVLEIKLCFNLLFLVCFMN